MAGQWSTQRLARMEKEVAHRYAAPVWIRNVRLFDSKKATVTEPVSVVVHGKQIAEVDSPASPSTTGEATIDGEGGISVPGMYEMHAHLNQEDALQT